MTGANFYAYILRTFKRTDKSTEAYEAMSDVIADIQYDTELEAVKEEAYSVGITTLGEYKMGLPTDFQNLIGSITAIEPNDNNSITLNKVSKEEYDVKYPDRLFSAYADMYSGEPRDFCIYAGQVYIGPVPDDVDYKYQMNYSTDIVTEISSATTTVPFTTNYKERNVTRAGVLAELFRGVENYEEANYWDAKYQQGKATMVVKDDRNIEDNGNLTYRSV